VNGPPSRALRLARALLTGLMVLALAWTGGLIAFAFSIPTSPSDRTTAADGIVVLTGGSERLAEGLQLLDAGLGRKLLVSGVAEGTTLEAVLGEFHPDPDKVACCIELGHTAANTEGNANEAADWMAREGFTSLRLVTGSYHMPRSLLEFRRVMPAAQLIANPVFPGHVKVEQWWRFRGTAGLIAREYVKYLGVTIKAFLTSSPSPRTPS
jgi:uncharacterized SAM-binding protein YcdF (DUF218 family)